ncbi:MAG: hypothetical protein GY696_19620 [Gammaproteobacteria bacterium]|nr:hypothetical protein [Gammaproteobacteria bacterium]
MKLFSFRNFRVLILLVILASVAIYTQAQRLDTMSWLEPLDLVVFPLNGDGSERTDRYIRRLKLQNFAAIDKFSAKQAKRFQVLAEQPTSTRLGPRIDQLPPVPPARDANPIAMIWWSLKLRIWAWQNTPDGVTGKNSVRMFVLYHQPMDDQVLAHSLGLQKGLLGIVNAYAANDQNKQNNIVIAHELLHTVGASDKYDELGLPSFPDGYAAPNRSPLYPQTRCEIMAGRIAVSKTEAKMAQSLRTCMVGQVTAKEIGWIETGE